MELLTPEELANFAKKYNRLVGSYLLCTFFGSLVYISQRVMNQGDNDLLITMYLLQVLLAWGFLIYSLFAAAATGKAACSSASKAYSDYFIISTIAVFVLACSPLANFVNIVSLIALCLFIRLLSSCGKRFKEHHVQIGLFVHQKNLKTALYTEEEIQNAEPLPRRTWGGYLKSRACMLGALVIFVMTIIGYYEFIKALPKTPTFEMALNMAQNGNADAQNAVGEAYYNGEEIEKSNDEAFAWFQKSAEGGCARGMHNLAVCYREGIGTTPDMAKSFACYQKAAEWNYPPAIYAMGVYLCEGIGVPKDEEKGKALIQKAAEMGFTP